MTAPMAVCRVDGEPLVSTLVFIYKEFVCVVCGRTYGFLDPEGVTSTPELEERQKEHVATWRDQHREDVNAAIENHAGWNDLDGREQRAATVAEWAKRHG